MRKIRPFLLMLVMGLAAASAMEAQQAAKPLTNQDVISMVKSLMPESVIISAIKTNDTAFDVSASGLIALKRAGVTAKVMEAVLAAVNSKKSGVLSPVAAPAASIPQPPAAPVVAANAANAGAAPVTAPPWQPSVTAFINGNGISLPAEATQIVHTKAKPTSLANLAEDKAMGQALQAGTQVAQQAVAKTGAIMGLAAFNPGAAVLTGILSKRAKVAKVTYVWALAGGTESSPIGAMQAFDVNYSGLPGVNADQFEPVIVRLSPTPQANFRLVGATEAANSADQSTQQDWPVYSSFLEDRIAANIKKSGYGHAQVAPSTALTAGEYAVVLRPVDKTKKFAGEEVARNRGEGLLFNYAWPFSVK